MSDDTLAWMNELTAEMEERRKRVQKGGGEKRNRETTRAGEDDRKGAHPYPFGR